MVMPLLAVVLMSFTSKGYMSFSAWNEMSFRWYYEVFQNEAYMDSLLTSITLGAIASTIACIIAVPACIALAKYDFYGKDFINSFLLSPLMIPHIVLGIAFLKFFSTVGISKSFLGLVIAHIVLISPYAMRLILAVVYSLDRNIDNAALSLGSNKFMITLKITLPLLLPGIVSGWLISFIQSFDELTMSIFLTPSNLITLPVKMYNDIDENLTPLITAVSGVVIFGAIALMFIIDKFFGLEKVLIGKK
jgi:putative spermidine/putrescine transport system permease protein